MTEVAKFDGYEIKTGFLTGDLFAGDTDGVDLSASVSSYAAKLEAALAEQFPGATITVDHQSGTGSTPHGLQTRVYGPDNGETEYPSLVELVDHTCQSVWESHDWIVEAEPTITLADYANDENRGKCVAFIVSHSWPTGKTMPVGHPDLDFLDRNDLLDLTGTVNAEGRWNWDGEGKPTDDWGNSINRIEAYPSVSQWDSLVEEYESEG